MSSKPNIESFVAVLKKSGLVESDRLQKAVASYTAGGGSTEDSTKLAEHLISNSTVTRWQAEKLLQGKHKGYFLGKYRLLSLLGKGGMSSVYLAEHTLMRRRCALKVLPTKRVHDSSYLARFHREAQAVASLDHPNIVRAYDVDHQADRENEIHFLVMEYVEGDSLQELVQKNGVCGFLDAAEYTRQSALGLHHAHEAGMVHRDVKPANLLVDPNGVVKVLDLGLARFFTGDENEESLTVAHDEKVLGTADYLAPEQALDSHTVDARADLYGLGCTLYFLLTGRPPFIEGTLTQRLMAHQTKTPPAVESLRTDTPASLAAIVRKMMEKKAENRHATARELADALFAWIDENADDAWRKAHSGIYGTSRKKEVGANATAVPVAKPVIAMPVASPSVFDFTQPAAPVRKPPSTKPDSATKLTLPSSAASQSVDPELSNFFASISGSQPVVTPKSSPKQPVASPPSLLKPPPHLAAKSSFKLPATAKPESDKSLPQQIEPTAPPLATASEFPEFSSTVPTVKPASSSSIISRATASTSDVVPRPTKVASPPSLFKSKTLPVSILAGIAGGFCVLLLLVSYSIGWLGDSTANTKGSPPTKWPADKREITVGGNKADFRSIVEALRAVRLRFEPSGPEDQFVIRIAAGIYKERISIDASQRKSKTAKAKQKTDKPADPDWPEGIKLIGEEGTILEPPGDAPVIRLKEISRLVIEGIEVNATDKSVAIEMSGYMPDTQLNSLTIRGFADTGISCVGVHGTAFGDSQSREVVFDKLRLEPNSGASTAVGIRMRGNALNSSSFIIVRGCRFVGSLSAGIAFSGTEPYSITMTENIFSQVRDGVHFEAAPWKNIVLVNNTFHDGRHGILFSKMPVDSAVNLTFRRNLFSQMSVAEGMVQTGYDESQFNGFASKEPPGLEDNWSDRPAPEKPQSGEIQGLFAQNGKRGEKGFAFASTEIKDPKFLAPSDTSVQRKVDLSLDPKMKLTFEKPWVGALGP